MDNGKYFVENVDILDSFENYEKLLTSTPTGQEAPEEVKKLLRQRNIYFK